MSDSGDALAERWRRMRPATPEGARERLERLAESLERNGYAYPAVAIRAYLTGLASSLDVAFGLVPPSHRGSRARRPETLERDIAILELSRQDTGRGRWKRIAQRLATDHPEWRVSPDEARKLVQALWIKPRTRAQRDLHERARAAYSAVLRER